MKKYAKKIVSFALVVTMSMTMFVPAFANGEISVYLDNEQIQFDVAPVLVNGRTMVPMRAIFEKLGAVVYWDNNTRTAIAQKENTNVSISIDDTVLYKNGTPITLDVPAQLNGGRTLVPLRAVSEAFECDVKWNGDSNVVNISSKKENSITQKAINKLLGWISDNYNQSADIGYKKVWYVQHKSSYSIAITPVTDSEDVILTYIDKASSDLTQFRLYLSNGQFFVSYGLDVPRNEISGNITKSTNSNKFNLQYSSFDIDANNRFNKTAEETLKAFEILLVENNIGLTLKDFALDYDLSSVNPNDNQESTIIPTPSAPQNSASNNNYQGGGGYSTNTKITLSSFPLYLYADDGTGTFLGNINSNQYDRESIANQYGDYGSQYKTKSIFNQYGDYGSQYSRYSVFNEYATNPPKILDKNGKVVGYLTANKYIRDAISYEEMMVLLKKFRK